jgi:hypothetical protein
MDLEGLVREHHELDVDLGNGSNWLQSRPLKSRLSSEQPRFRVHDLQRVSASAARTSATACSMLFDALGVEPEHSIAQATELSIATRIQSAFGLGSRSENPRMKCSIASSPS